MVTVVDLPAAVLFAVVRFAAGRVACCASAISVPFPGDVLPPSRKHGSPRRGPSRAV
ncbi:hypothetical protein J3R08_004678 [Micromonospora sp. HB375]|nr:hypothetical protein [Micromonospora sp. HB375]